MKTLDDLRAEALAFECGVARAKAELLDACRALATAKDVVQFCCRVVEHAERDLDRWSEALGDAKEAVAKFEREGASDGHNL